MPDLTSEQIKRYIAYKKAVGISKEILFEWHERSSRINTGNIEKFTEYWDDFEEFIKNNQDKNYLSLSEINRFEDCFKKEFQKNSKLPIIHHSKKYIESNNPSYRVINMMIVEDFMKENMYKR